MMQHQYNSVSELVQAAAEPIQDGNGTMLQQKSAPEQYGESGGYGFSHGRGSGAGTWDIISASGRPALQLSFHNGEQQIHRITLQGNDLFLENRRYFRTRNALCH